MRRPFKNGIEMGPCVPQDQQHLPLAPRPKMLHKFNWQGKMSWRGAAQGVVVYIFSLRQIKVVKMRNEHKQQVNNKLLLTFINGSGGILINTFRDTEFVLKKRI